VCVEHHHWQFVRGRIVEPRIAVRPFARDRRPGLARRHPFRTAAARAAQLAVDVRKLAVHLGKPGQRIGWQSRHVRKSPPYDHHCRRRWRVVDHGRNG